MSCLPRIRRALPIIAALGLTLPGGVADAKGGRRGATKTQKPGKRRAATGPGERRKGIERPKRDKERGKDKRTLVKRQVTERGCHLRGHTRTRRSLLAWRNTSQLMNLEVWGDTKRYRPGQKVFFFFRSPRDVYVTLFWIGPNGDIVIPLSNTRIEANRDVRIWTGGIVVPPLGRERWVAVSALETMPMRCNQGDSNWLATIKAFKAIPHGVGRWEVHSQ